MLQNRIRFQSGLPMPDLFARRRNRHGGTWATKPGRAQKPARMADRGTCRT